MKIEAGKFYKTRDGHKVEIYSTDNGKYRPVHGRIFGVSDDGNSLDAFKADGKYFESGNDDNWDLVSEWREPVIDWSKYPKWIKAVAMDKSGCCCGYSSVPVALNDVWDVDYPEASRLFRSD